ncbi:uncharacterized protein TNCV_3630361 [Trichonephila clavipes]|nr:uncharacterized protein TNCV_3630361 [Trichonephila clavipes]
MVDKKAWITSDEAQFHLSFTTGKTKIQYISSKKRRKDAAILKNASWPLGAMEWTEISSQGLTNHFCAERNFKIDAKYYQNKVLKHLIKKSKRLYPQRNAPELRGLSYPCVADRNGRTPMIVSGVWNRWAQDDNAEHRPGSQRFPIPSRRNDSHVTCMDLMDYTVTSQALSQELGSFARQQVSARTA